MSDSKLEDMLKDAFLISIGAVLSALTGQVEILLMVSFGLLVVMALVKIPKLFCDTCRGSGKQPCASLCVNGYRSPTPATYRWETVGLVDKGDKGAFYRIDNITYVNQGGRGSARLIMRVSDFEGVEIGIWRSEEIKMEARTQQPSIAARIAEIPIDNLQALKRKLGKEPNRGDFNENRPDWEIIDKGDSCAICKGSGRVKCKTCGGKRLKIL